MQNLNLNKLNLIKIIYYNKKINNNIYIKIKFCLNLEGMKLLQFKKKLRLN